MIFFLYDDFFKHASGRGVTPFEGFIYDLSVQHYSVVFRGVTQLHKLVDGFTDLG
jgi:hypothetical protein